MLPFIHMIKNNLTDAQKFVRQYLIVSCNAGWKEGGRGKVIKALNLPGDFLPLPTPVAYCLIHQVDLSERLLEDSPPPPSLPK